MESQSYANFWQRIHKSARNKAFPLRVMFELTYRCNFRCRHCYVPQNYRKKRELKTEEVFSILKQLKDIGCFYLGFTGGEPFIREDIIDIFWYAKKLGFEIIIYTNGSLIDKKIAQELAHLRPNKVDITIPAISRGAFEQVTRMPGSHKKVFSAIDLLHKKGVKLGFKTCALKENASEIKDIEDFARSLGALHRLDNMLSPRLDGSKEPYKYRGKRLAVVGYRLSDCHYRLPHHTADRKPHTAHRTPHTAHLFRCGVGISQAAITPQGELKMCLMIDYPKYKLLTESSDFGYRLSVIGYRRTPKTANRTPRNLKEAWQRLKDLVASIKPDENYKCNQCQLEPYCKWCPAQAWLENKSFTTCDPEHRRWAEIRNQRSEVGSQKKDRRKFRE